MSIHTPTLQKGSTVVIVLLFTLLLLIGLTGTTYLLVKTIKSTAYITDTIQAGYASESGTELALYELKLRREGYEHPVITHTSSLLPTASTSYNIQYSAKEHNGLFQTPSVGDISTTLHLNNNEGQSKTMALFKDDGTQQNIIPWIPSTLTLHTSSNNPEIEIKLSGKSTQSSQNRYDTFTTTYTQPGGDISLLQLSGKVRTGTLDNLTAGPDMFGFDNEASPTLLSYLNNHSEVYMTIRNLNRDENLSFTIESNLPFASYFKTVTSTGTYNNVKVSKVTQIEQTQLPELFSVVLTQ